MSGIRGEHYIDESGNEVLTGGLRCAQTNKEKYGEDYYRNMGRKGGKKGAADGVLKGFAVSTERAKRAGAIGGRISRRGYEFLGEEDGILVYRRKEDEAIVEFPKD